MQWMRHFEDIPNHIQEKSYDEAVHPECGYEGHFRCQVPLLQIQEEGIQCQDYVRSQAGSDPWLQVRSLVQREVPAWRNRYLKICG